MDSDTANDTPRPGRASAPHSAEELTRRNVERVMALEAAQHRKARPSERVADAITRFSGSIGFVWFSLVLVAGWIGLNLFLPTRDRLDPFPFPLLTLVLSVEAIFLSIFILMSQNRSARIDEKRGHLDLQLNMLSEQENTKMLGMLEEIGRAVGAEFCDGPDVDVLTAATEPEGLSQMIDEAVEDREEGHGRGKDSPTG
jgi:uncharacterized membrane protein